MSNQNTRFAPPPSLAGLMFHHTEDYPCSYLPDRQAASIVAVPPQRVDTAAYSTLVGHGFRRSGLFVYRPDCASCHACRPIRIPVERFVPNRRQRRCLQRHADLTATERPLAFDEAHYALYQRYQCARHPGGGMDNDEREQYAGFLLQSTIDSRIIEFADSGVLRMVSVIDVLDDGLSAVYTFYDPDLPQASFGTYGVLWQISQCLANRLPYVYLGYWISACRKMAYKADFRPAQILCDGLWCDVAEMPSGIAR